MPTTFEFDELPDSLAQAEATWHMVALAHCFALEIAYLSLLDEPDSKAAWCVGKASDAVQKSIRRAYPEGEAELLIRLSRKSAINGVKQQKEIQEKKS